MENEPAFFKSAVFFQKWRRVGQFLFVLKSRFSTCFPAKMQANSQYVQHFQAAKSCLRRERYGEALAHIVFLANVEPSSKDNLEEDFIVALRQWTEILEQHGELEKLMVCLQEALKLYPQSEAVLMNTGAHLLKLGCTDEAASCFRRVLSVNDSSVRAREYLENIANLLVERWHFRMLNDKKRNLAYKEAICKAISQGYDTVLDIGSGTGILSMFAVQGGAREVYACEMSKTMYEMGCDVLKANNMDSSVHCIQKKSTEISVGEDIPKKVSLVVTETLDCGLLGEGILATVQHAWKHLLMPSKPSHVKAVSKVIPSGAVVYAMAIMCDDIRNQIRSKPVVSGIKMSPELTVGGEVMEKCSEGSSKNICNQLEPYSTECLNNLRGGFIPLCHPFKVTEYNFNNPSSLYDDRKLHFEVLATNDGCVDAIAMWFDLQLNEEISLSTGPQSDSLCWEQAVFPVHLDNASSLCGINRVSKGDLMSIYGHLSKDCLRLYLNGAENDTEDMALQLSKDQRVDSAVKTTSLDLETEVSCKVSKDITVIPPSYLRRLNDKIFNELYDKSICDAMKSANPNFNNGGIGSQETSEHKRDIPYYVLDITYGPTLFPFFASRSKADRVLISNPHDVEWIKHILNGNNLPHVIEYGPKKLEDISKDATGRKWNVLISDIVEPSGIIRQQVVEDIVFARGCLLRPEGYQIIPMGFTMYCMCIESPFLFANCRILSQDNTLGLDIGRFVNEFQVSTQVDLDLTTLPFSAVTDHAKILDLNFMQNFDTDQGLLSMLETHSKQKVRVVKSGRIQAIPYWYVLHIDNVHSLSTYSGAYTGSHWRQAAVVLKEDIIVEAGQELLISASCVNSCIFINVNVAMD